jgi:hypothetical protein
MKKRRFSYSSIFFTFLFLLFAAHAPAVEDWVPFDGAPATEAFTVDVPLSTMQEVIVDLDIPGMYVEEIIEEGIPYQVLRIQGAGYTTEVGEPQVPMIGRFIAVPSGAMVTAEVVDSTSKMLEGYNVYPAQEPLPDIADAPIPPFAIDAELYQQDAFYPRDIVELEGPSIIRGCSVVILRVFPVQFNPARQTLRVYSNIRVKVSFAGGQGYFLEERLRSAPFDQIFSQLFLNASNMTDRDIIEAAYDDGNLLLIITHPNFLDAANTLADWKREKGIYTDVQTTTVTGSTASAIQSYIQNAYDTWSPPPTYVLFIGDAEFIPCHYVTYHPYNSSIYCQGCQGDTGTDLYYATVDGTDYFPDISLGRLSVDTLAEANKRVNDIIAYERTPVTTASFYDNIAICAYFQHYGSGYAERRFAQTSEDLAIYFSDPSFLGDYSVDRIYYAHSGVYPRYWATTGIASWNFGGGPAGDPGDPIPAHLRKDVSPFFPWDGDSTDISNAINAGRFLVTHRDHGAATGWGDPYYNVGHVQALTNADRLPVVWSLNCQTGWFDNETDNPTPQTSATAIHFSEAWERNPNGGAVGVIGATRVSYSGHNDRMCWGFTDAIWPNFEPAGYSASGTPFDDPEFEMGPVLNYGKYYYATHYGHSTTRLTTFEMFMWFGDPTTQIWTDLPQSLTVSHDATVPEATTSLGVTVGTNTGVVICVSKDSQILGRRYRVGSGTETISWSTPLVAGEELLVTVTGHNYRPYQGTVAVAELRPDLVVLSIETSPSQPEPGTTVDISVTVKNLGPGDAGGFWLDWYANRTVAPVPAPGNFGDRAIYLSGGLAAGASHVWNTTYAYPSRSSNLMYAYADTEYQVDEKNETNNILGPDNILVGVCECDLNVDGRCDMQDWLVFGGDWGRTDCPIPAPETVAETVVPNDNPSGHPDEGVVEGEPIFRQWKVETASFDGQGGQTITPPVEAGPSTPGGDIGDTYREPTAYAPMWERLERLDLSERDNAQIQLEVAEDLPATMLGQVRTVEGLWNSGNFDAAIEALRGLEAEGLDVALGISWKIPVALDSLEWFDDDVRITARKNAGENHLDYDAQTGNLFAVVKRVGGDSPRWTANISQNGGRTWQETYTWSAPNEIIDVSAAVVDQYLYIGYVGIDAFGDASTARIRRCFVSNGAVDTDYYYKVVFDKEVDIREIALATNADDWDNKVYYFAILSNYHLIFHHANQDGVTWYEINTGVTDAWQGLDATWNEGYSSGSGYFLYASYIAWIVEAAEVARPVMVARLKGTWEEIQVLSDYTGAQNGTSISAYQDTVICAYEYQYTEGMGIRYNISYNGGGSWSYGTLAAPPSGSNYYNPDVTARGGSGTAIVYDDEAGAFDPVWYRYRDHYSPGSWSTPVQINELDDATAWPNRIEWIPAFAGGSYAYGTIYISWSPDSGTAYFDRSDGGPPCECDLNHDGRCDMQDWLLFGGDWGQTNCPIPLTNIAPLATATSSGGGQTQYGYGPEEMNDGVGESACTMHWVSAGSGPGSSAWIQLNWSSPVTVQSMALYTVGCEAQCGYNGGRILSYGTIQHWNGKTWVTDGSVSEQKDDWPYTFSGLVTTTGIRIYGVAATTDPNCGNFRENPVVFEWEVYGRAPLTAVEMAPAPVEEESGMVPEGVSPSGEF